MPKYLVSLAILVVACLSTAGSRPAFAQSVALSCTVTITDFAFGSFDVLSGSSVPTNATLSVSCLNVTATTGNLYLCVAIPGRVMTGSSLGKKLAYDIFGPTPSTISWSNTAPIVIPFASLRLNQAYSINVQAAVGGSQQSLPPDDYNQSLTATTTYGSSSCTTGLPNTGSASFHATVTISKSCNVSAGNLTFGSVTSLAANVDGQTALALQCSNGTGYTVGLDGGLSGASDPTARKMTGSGDSVTYGLYQNSARSTPWSASQTLGGTGTSAMQTIPVYGRVPAQTTPAPGTYSDTVVVTVTY